MLFRFHLAAGNGLQGLSGAVGNDLGINHNRLKNGQDGVLP